MNYHFGSLTNCKNFLIKYQNQHCFCIKHSYDIYLSQQVTNFYMHDIYVFGKCCRSWDAMTSVKNIRDIQYVNISIIPQTKKITEREKRLSSPSLPFQIHWSRCTITSVYRGWVWGCSTCAPRLFIVSRVTGYRGSPSIIPEIRKVGR